MPRVTVAAGSRSHRIHGLASRRHGVVELLNKGFEIGCKDLSGAAQAALGCENGGVFEIGQVDGQVLDHVLANQPQPIDLLLGERFPHRHVPHGAIHPLLGRQNRLLLPGRVLDHGDDVRQSLVVDQSVGFLQIALVEMAAAQLLPQLAQGFRLPAPRPLQEDADGLDLLGVFAHEPGK